MTIAGVSPKPCCVVVTWFYPDQPGYLDFSYRIHALARAYQLTLVSRSEIVQQEIRLSGIDYVVVNTTECATKDLFSYTVRVAALIRASKPELVVLLGSQVAAVKLLIGARPTATYWNEHPTHYLNPISRNFATRYLRTLFRALLYKGARDAEVVMPIGEAHLEDLIAHGVEPVRARLIYMGVAASFAPAPAATRQGGSLQAASSNPVRLIYTGTVIRERGRDVMLEGLAKANASRRVATLTMVGAQPEQIAYCEARARELGIGDALKVIGRVPGASIPALLAEADAGICVWEDRLYWRFNPPTKLFEYLVAGLPVMASNIRTHTDYIRDWENGVVFDYTAASFAEQVNALWERRADLPRMRACALAESGSYLWSNLEKQFLSALPLKA